VNRRQADALLAYIDAAMQATIAAHIVDQHGPLDAETVVQQFEDEEEDARAAFLATVDNDTGTAN
jgi:hypothetical protein